ncbi:lysozyme [Paramagnetospirillum caucaseum]|uniref:Lysozyme n=1 Tax=Paramagnetospirillum caucaseum TaxID=1244869 RepID=M3AEU4_9PROT|nr:lysozyme [Paramagnetospirillum caucaseum]EME71378.1 lysozyme [Paramagnetospirillum caucaseum]
MSITTLRAELVRDEGLRLKPYRCTAGKLTIGIGRNIEDRGISEATALQMLDEDIAGLSAELDRAIPWWRNLSDARQRALINMAMMGVPRLLGFRRMLAALQAGDYAAAAAESLASKWADQTDGIEDGRPGARSTRVADMIRKG